MMDAARMRGARPPTTPAARAQPPRPPMSPALSNRSDRNESQDAELRRIKRTAEEVFAEHRREADAKILELETSFDAALSRMRDEKDREVAAVTAQLRDAERLLEQERLAHARAAEWEPAARHWERQAEVETASLRGELGTEQRACARFKEEVGALAAARSELAAAVASKSSLNSDLDHQ